MRIISFNVNGLRSIRDYYTISKQWSFDDFLDSFDADIICMQEIKANESSRLDQQMLTPSRYHAYYAFHRPNSVKKIGYAGVATFCKKSSEAWLPKNYEEGFTGTISTEEINHIGTIPEWEEEIPIDLDTLKSLDSEARCMITDHGKFVLMNVYFPNDSGEPERDYFRGFFYSAIFKRATHLSREGFNVIIAGDINVAYHPRDHCEFTKIYQQSPNPKEVLEQAIYHNDGPLKEFYESKPLRRWIYKEIFINKTCIDPFRLLHPEELNQYTCWSTLLSTRANNYGTRIDYFLCFGHLFKKENDKNNSNSNDDSSGSNDNVKIFKECSLMPQVLGSDHCPIFLDLNLLSNDTTDSSLSPLSHGQEHKFRIQQQHQFKQIESFFKRKNKEEKEKEKEKDKIIIPIENKVLTSHASSLVTMTSPPPMPTIELNNHNKEEEEDKRELSCDPFSPNIATFNSNAISDEYYFGKPIIPNCSGHNLPCTLQTVRKTGSNRGRQFWTCSKPIGNEGNPEAKCKFFKWKNVKNK